MDSLSILEEAEAIFNDHDHFGAYLALREKAKADGLWKSPPIAPDELKRLRSWDYFLHRCGVETIAPVLAPPPF